MTSLSQKTFAPSSGRKAAAARLGLIIQSPILIFGGVLLLTATTGLLFSKYTDMFALPSLSHALIQSKPSVYLTWQLRRVFLFSIFWALPCLGLSITAIIFVRKQKSAGQTNVPIDSAFSTFFEDLATNLLSAITACAVVISIFKNAGFSYPEIQYAPIKGAHRLLQAFLWSGIGAGAVFITGGLIQLSLRRMRLFQHLSLTKSEQEKEQRLHGQSRTKRGIRNAAKDSK